MKITEDLVKVYYATLFRIFAPTGLFAIEAVGESTELEGLVVSRKVDGAAFITEYKPLSEPTDDAGSDGPFSSYEEACSAVSFAEAYDEIADDWVHEDFC